jgi:glycosyltransferase EpsF
MIRVLHIVAKMNLGGTETYLMNIYRNIDRTKVQFDFLTYYESGESGYYDEEIITLGGQIHNLKSISKLGPLKAINEIKKLIKVNNYNIIHAHTTYSIGFSMIAGYLANSKIRIAHSHNTGTGVNSIKENLYGYIMKKVIKLFSTKFCACSKNAAIHLFGTTNKFDYLPNAVDLSRFLENSYDNNNLKIELSIDCNKKVIGHVGRYGKAKNHEFIIELFYNILNKNKELILVLVGDGETRINIENQAKELGIYQNIRFLGLRNDVDKLMSIFDTFILPSKYEGFGIVLLEAQASGLPCIVSENIQPEVDLGLNLVKWENLSNIDKWTDTILSKLNSKQNDKSLIEKKIQNSEFEIKNVVNKFYGLYEVKI